MKRASIVNLQFLLFKLWFLLLKIQVPLWTSVKTSPWLASSEQAPNNCERLRHETAGVALSIENYPNFEPNLAQS